MARRPSAINSWYSQGYDDDDELNTGDDGVYSGDEIADTDYSWESDDDDDTYSGDEIADTNYSWESDDDDDDELNTGDDGVYSGDEIADTDYSWESDDSPPDDSGSSNDTTAPNYSDDRDTPPNQESSSSGLLDGETLSVFSSGQTWDITRNDANSATNDYVVTLAGGLVGRYANLETAKSIARGADPSQYTGLSDGESITVGHATVTRDDSNSLSNRYVVTSNGALVGRYSNQAHASNIARAVGPDEYGQDTPEPDPDPEPTSTPDPAPSSSTSSMSTVLVVGAVLAVVAAVVGGDD